MSSSDRCDQVRFPLLKWMVNNLLMDLRPLVWLSTDSIENVEESPNELCLESDINKFWEVEVDNPSNQIIDVQGWLKKNLKFWQEVLEQWFRAWSQTGA